MARRPIAPPAQAIASYMVGIAQGNRSMGLKITLRPGERLVVNGTVIRSNGRHSVELLLDSRARVLREAALMSEDEACSPARRLYFAAQLAYVDDVSLDFHRRHFVQRFEDLALIVVSDDGRSILRDCAIAAARLDWWNAMRACKRLIAYEDRVLTLVEAATRATISIEG
jgi:flagellar biosynthesis repressor protein FlbT